MEGLIDPNAPTGSVLLDEAALSVMETWQLVCFGKSNSRSNFERCQVAENLFMSITREVLSGQVPLGGLRPYLERIGEGEADTLGQLEVSYLAYIDRGLELSETLLEPSRPQPNLEGVMNVAELFNGTVRTALQYEHTLTAGMLQNGILHLGMVSSGAKGRFGIKSAFGEWRQALNSMQMDIRITDADKLLVYRALLADVMDHVRAVTSEGKHYIGKNLRESMEGILQSYDKTSRIIGVHKAALTDVVIELGEVVDPALLDLIGAEARLPEKAASPQTTAITAESTIEASPLTQLREEAQQIAGRHRALLKGIRLNAAQRKDLSAVTKIFVNGDSDAHATWEVPGVNSRLGQVMTGLVRKTIEWLTTLKPPEAQTILQALVDEEVAYLAELEHYNAAFQTARGREYVVPMPDETIKTAIDALVGPAGSRMENLRRMLQASWPRTEAPETTSWHDVVTVLARQVDGESSS